MYLCVTGLVSSDCVSVNYVYVFCVNVCMNTAAVVLFIDLLDPA